jgi:hypothetical protein
MGSIIGSLRKRIYDRTGKTLSERQDEVPSIRNNWTGAKHFFEHNLVEVRFKRRITKEGGYKKTRNMIMTSNFFYGQALAISLGKPLKKPKIKRKKSWYRTRNLILVFDVIEGNYRMVNLDPPNFEVIDFISFRKENLQLIGGWQTKYNIKNISSGKKRKLANR